MASRVIDPIAAGLIWPRRSIFVGQIETAFEQLKPQLALRLWPHFAAGWQMHQKVSNNRIDVGLERPHQENRLDDTTLVVRLENSRRPDFRAALASMLTFVQTGTREPRREYKLKNTESQ